MNQIDTFFDALITQGGSDLHLSQAQPPKIRRHGDIVPLRDEPLTEDEMIALLQPICSKKGWEKYLKCGDHDFAYERDHASRFRCNYHKHLHGHGAIFRIISVTG